MRKQLIALVLLVPSIGLTQECTLPEHVPPSTGHAALAGIVVDGVVQVEQMQLLLLELMVGLKELEAGNSASRRYIDGLLAALEELTGIQKDQLVLMKTRCVNALEMIDILVTESGRGE